MLVHVNDTEATEDGVIPSHYLIVCDILYGIGTFPAIVGNAIIIVCVFKSSCRTKNIYILICNLAFSDLIVGSILMPYGIIVDIFGLNSNKYVCLTKAAILVLAINGTCFGLMMMSIDRFSAVCFPFQHQNRMTSSRISYALISGWTCAFVVATLPIFGWNQYHSDNKNGCLSNSVFDPIYKGLIATFLGVMFGINCVLYVIVAVVAFKGSFKHLATAVHTEAHSRKEPYRVMTLAIIQGLFVACWLPFVTLTILASSMDSQVLYDASGWSLIPGLLNSSLNWFVFGYRNRQLRKKFKLCITCNLT